MAVWDLKQNKQHELLDGRVSADPVPSLCTGGSLAFSHDGKFLAMGTGFPYNHNPKRSDLKVWRVNDWSEIGAPLFRSNRILSAVTFTPDGTCLLAADHSGLVRIWNTTTWELEDRTFDVGTHAIKVSITISDDGRIMATSTPGTGITLWDFPTGEKLRVMVGAEPWVLDFSPNGRTLASGTKHNVILWDVATGRQLRTFQAHSDAVLGVAFSPDGNRLAAVSSDGVLQIWEAATSDEIDRDLATHKSMLRLAEMRNKAARYADAEAILKRLLDIQRKHLGADHPVSEKVKAELDFAIKEQGTSPDHPPPD